MEGMFKLLSGRFPLPNPGGWMVGFERPSLCTEARTQPHGGKSAVENQADAPNTCPTEEVKHWPRLKMWGKRKRRDIESRKPE